MDTRQRRIRRLYRSGLSERDVAATVGCARGTVRLALNKHPAVPKRGVGAPLGNRNATTRRDTAPDAT